MNKLKIGNVLDLASMIEEYKIQDFDGYTGNGKYPIIIMYDDNLKYMGFVSLSDFEDKEYIQKISSILERHDRFIKNQMPSSDYSNLMKARAELARQSEWLGRLRAQYAAEHKASEFKRRRVFDNMLLINKKNGDTDGVSRAKARQEIKAYDDEVTDFLKLKLEAEALVKVVDQTLNAMAGEVRQLEKEQSRTNIQDI